MIATREVIKVQSTPLRVGSSDDSVFGVRGFKALWSATTASGFGSAVTLVALPILAAQQLGAGAAELGYLRAFETVPYVALAMVVGRLADTVPPLHLMIASDVARALLLFAVVALALTSTLSLGFLFVAAFAIGALTVTYDVAQFTLLPAVVPKGRMARAASAIELARGAAGTLGPGLGGFLTATLRAGPTLLADALSYVFSACALWRLRDRSAAHHAQKRERTDRHERAAGFSAGLVFLYRTAELRGMTAYLGMNNLCNQAFTTGLIIYLEVSLQRTSLQLGTAFALYGAGFLIAAPLAPRLGRTLGVRISVVTSSLLSAAGIGFVAILAPGGPTVFDPVVGAAVGAFVVGFAAPIFNVQSMTLRLSVTPVELLGRVNGVVKLVSQGALPLGALAGGALFSLFQGGTAFGIIAAASLLATVVLLRAPLPRLAE